MLIVCPNCQTCYSVDRQRFEPSGRTVRCSNCGNSWRQGPVASPPPAYAPAPQVQHQQTQQSYPPPPPGYMPYPPPGYPPYPPPGYPPYPAQAGAPAATPEPAAPAAPPPPPPVDEDEDEDDEVIEPNFDLPDPEDDDDLDDGIAANIDAMFGEDDDDDDFDIEEDIPDETGGDDLSDDEIDGLFDDDSDQTGISSMVDSGSGDSGADDIDDLDDIPEPDPLPESLTGSFDDDEDEDEDDVPVGRPRRKQAKAKKKGKGGLIALIVILILLIGIVAAGFFARALIVELVPQTKTVYDMIGIETGVLGDGLEIQDVKSTRGTDAGTDILVVSGTIRNIETEPRPVPLVQAVLLDGEGVEMQSVVQEPALDALPAGGSVDFAIRIEEPSPLSRRLEVTFAPRPEAGGHDEGH